LEAAVRYVSMPCDDRDVVLGESKLGGDPDLPAGTEWPHWTRPDGAVHALRFHAQFDLADAHAAAPGDLDLPADGLLSLFADTGTVGDGIIGLDPRERDGSTIVHTPARVELHRTPSPQAPSRTARLVEVGLWTWFDDPADGDELDALAELRDRCETSVRAAAGFSPGGALHQLGGTPFGLQHPVLDEVVAALADCYRSGGFDQDRWEHVRHQVDEWRVVAQLDSDAAADIWFGDAGIVSWAARRDDVAAGRFDNGMFNFQCL
jgi:uncharacterized protein YwqG